MLSSVYSGRLREAASTAVSYTHLTSGKYGLVELKERYKDIRLPHIELVDIKELAHQKRMQGPFSPALVKQIKEALECKMCIRDSIGSSRLLRLSTSS